MVREAAENVLTRREPSFTEVAEALSLGAPFCVRLSEDGQLVRFVHIGRACREILGVSAAELEADALMFAELVVPEDMARLMSEKTAVAAGAGPTWTEIRIRKPTGELRWLRLTAARRPAPEGGWLLDGLIVDVSETRRLSAQLAEERQRLQQAIELTGMGMFDWSRDDPDHMHWSDQQYDIFGLPRETAISPEIFRAMIHPDDAEAVVAKIRSEIENAAGNDVQLEHRIVRRDGEVRWVQLHLRVSRDPEGAIALHGTTLDVTSRRSAEEQRRLQMRELAHRAKNAMAVLIAMVQQAARTASSAEELANLLMARLEAMARSQDLASAADGRPLAFLELARAVLEPFDLGRFELDEALVAVTLPAEAMVPLALLLHELATNAVKYGALSAGGGRVEMVLAASRDGRVEIDWRETGGPPVAPPSRKGFGARLLAAVLQTRGGAVTPEFHPDGFRARIEMPAA